MSKKYSDKRIDKRERKFERMSLNTIELGNPETSHDNRKSKLWSKQYILTLIAMFAASITMTLFMPLLPIYIKMIGGNISLAGLVVSIFTIAALIFRPISAVLIDKYGRKSILIIGFVLITVGCLGYRFITLMYAFLIIRVIHGIGYGSSTNATGAIVADVVPKERRGQGIGYYGFVMASSVALGPALGLLVMKNFNIKAAFGVAIVLAAIGLIASLFISYEQKPTFPHSPKNSGKVNANSSHGFGYEKTALPASLVMLLVAFAYSGIVTFLPTYANVLGLGDISIYFIIYAVALLVTRIAVDRITKKRNISVVLLPGIVLMAVAFILLSIGKTLPYFLIAAVIYGVGYGSVQPTLNAIVVSLCKPSRRGSANSTFFSAMDLGIGVGAFVWGIVSQTFGYSAIYYGCIGFMVLSIVAYFKLLARQLNKAV